MPGPMLFIPCNSFCKACCWSTVIIHLSCETTARWFSNCPATCAIIAELFSEILKSFTTVTLLLVGKESDCFKHLKESQIACFSLSSMAPK